MSDARGLRYLTTREAKMATDSIRCVLVKIHGIGQQPQDWSRDFDTALANELTASEQARVAQQSVWWAPLSRLPGTSTAALGSGLASGSHPRTAAPHRPDLVDRQPRRSPHGDLLRRGHVISAIAFGSRQHRA